MPTLRKFDRKVPPPLPAHRMLSRIARVDPVADLRAWDGPVKDQGSEGACTMHAGTSTKEWTVRRYLNKKFGSLVFSPQYGYAQELILQGDFPNDVGSDGNTLCEVLTKKGCCELALYPYVSGEIKRPTPEQDANAAGHKLGGYHGLTSAAVAITIMGDPVPWPVMMGFTVYESFESNEVAVTGIYNPKPGERNLGGHEMKSSGYDVGEIPTLRPVGCPPAVLFQNSWSPSWGRNGYVWVALSVLDDKDTDLKIAHEGHPWSSVLTA